MNIQDCGNSILSFFAFWTSSASVKVATATCQFLQNGKDFLELMWAKKFVPLTAQAKHWQPIDFSGDCFLWAWCYLGSSQFGLLPRSPKLRDGSGLVLSKLQRDGFGQSIWNDAFRLKHVNLSWRKLSSHAEVVHKFVLQMRISWSAGWFSCSMQMSLVTEFEQDNKPKETVEEARDVAGWAAQSQPVLYFLSAGHPSKKYNENETTNQIQKKSQPAWK